MITEYFTVAIEIAGIIKSLGKFITLGNSKKNILIRELNQNLVSFDNAKKTKMNYDQLISILSNEKTIMILEKGFMFNLIKFGNIKDAHIKDKRNKRYKGKNCKWLFVNICEKIQELKNLKKAHKSFKNIKGLNISLQFSNLFYKMKLLSDFITTK